ncbi:MAG: DUF3299 domain-containing protein [Xanthomonadales bacterium]|nr:DUF3299 domain-containing protein [Xanthomonadales bacterium]NIN59666.1 DUF3299 domain-containing protein [Xanthomonadales bacterium]NIN75079.1 DUF3299 domain-containing protein [Xanthomonadales bacterium]NIO13413.1 DUF3299 domain-containing protein [Xanthomonadales bacterium]NIP12059.1 DUF3299 domain-containing protein [Xanthomonadales bacterium]
MRNLRSSGFVLFLCVFAQCALAQTPMEVDWPVLADPDGQQFDDPYRDLTKQQFESLMALARLQLALRAELAEEERTDLEKRALDLSQDLQSQGLDPDWILAQREAVAQRRQRAALATNAELEGEYVELRGYLLVARDIENGAMVAHLLPDRGVCMHLPPPLPNQVVKLAIKQLPEPLGACIAAAVRGRLSAAETRATIPVFDDTILLWSRWHLEVNEAITSGIFPAENG